MPCNGSVKMIPAGDLLTLDLEELTEAVAQLVDLEALEPIHTIEALLAALETC